ncbi:MAG TPA: hypothetical protein PLV42_00280 [bacterium]|nr:hypothetical protein [bacterium]
MSKLPSIDHQVIVDYILSGHTTTDAREYFGFKNDNIANLRVHLAFKALNIPRPRFQEERTCQFCGKPFVARDRYQRTCGAEDCQKTLIRDWQGKNPESKKDALKKYRSTEKGRQNRIRAGRQTRIKGKTGTTIERWNFATTEIKKSLRKLKYLVVRNPWEYRFQHIQNLAKMNREFRSRKARTFINDTPSDKWQEALRAVQTTIIQVVGSNLVSRWEASVNRIGATLRTANKAREWKINKTKKQYL